MPGGAQAIADTGEVDDDSRDKDGQTLSRAVVGGHEAVVDVISQIQGHWSRLDLLLSWIIM